MMMTRLTITDYGKWQDKPNRSQFLLEEFQLPEDQVSVCTNIVLADDLVAAPVRRVLLLNGCKFEVTYAVNPD